MEEPLEGGNTTPGVVKIGDSVRRPRGRGSVFAARVLEDLNARGYLWSPRYLGTDDEGRDVLAFVDGTTTTHPLERDERSYAAVGRMLRELHDLTRGTELASGGDCIVHGDPGPFNVVMRDGMPVALIDWDTVRAGDPLEDLGYAAWTWCIQPVHKVPVADQARRLRQLACGYDTALQADAVLAAVGRAQLHVIEAEARNADDPTLSAARRTHARAAIEWATSDRRVIEENRSLFEQAF